MGRDEEPMTPSARIFLRPEMDLIIHCVFGFGKAIDVQTLKDSIASSVVVLAHPRFSSLLVHDGQGREKWRKTNVNIDRHFIVIDDDADEESWVDDYVADLSTSSPLATDKPLWEFHLLMNNKCLVIRMHHALGDGTSLMALLLSICRRADYPNMLPTGSTGGRSSSERPRTLRKLVKATWITTEYVSEFIRRVLWLKDKTTSLRGGDGVEHWPKKLANAKFLLEDMKIVKRAVAGSTINDVLFAIISMGFSKYLQVQSPSGLPEGFQITGVALFNLRPQSNCKDTLRNSGNKFGMLLLPVYYHKPDVSCNPLKHVEKAKEMMTKKKMSLEAYFSYKMGQLAMSCFGSKASTYLFKKVIRNTTFTISNVFGPQEDITMGGHPIDYIRVSVSNLAHAITMIMTSYAGKAEMQILVAKDIIPDPEILAKYFENALNEMKAAAIKTVSN